jgi:hypothetical protein
LIGIGAVWVIAAPVHTTSAHTSNTPQANATLSARNRAHPARHADHPRMPTNHHPCASFVRTSSWLSHFADATL